MKEDQDERDLPSSSSGRHMFCFAFFRVNYLLGIYMAALGNTDNTHETLDMRYGHKSTLTGKSLILEHCISGLKTETFGHKVPMMVALHAGVC